MGHGNGTYPLVRNTTHKIHLHFCGKLFLSTLDLRFLVSLQGPPLPLLRWHRNLDGRMIDSRGSPGLADWDWELGWIPWMTPSLSAWKTEVTGKIHVVAANLWECHSLGTASCQNIFSFERFFVTLLMVGWFNSANHRKGLWKLCSLMYHQQHQE